eukprot:PhM_4_TR333/c0_g1_i1/m.61118
MYYSDSEYEYDMPVEDIPSTVLDDGAAVIQEDSTSPAAFHTLAANTCALSRWPKSRHEPPHLSVPEAASEAEYRDVLARLEHAAVYHTGVKYYSADVVRSIVECYEGILRVQSHVVANAKTQLAAWHRELKDLKGSVEDLSASVAISTASFARLMLETAARIKIMAPVAAAVPPLPMNMLSTEVSRPPTTSCCYTFDHHHHPHPAPQPSQISARYATAQMNRKMRSFLPETSPKKTNASTTTPTTSTTTTSSASSSSANDLTSMAAAGGNGQSARGRHPSPRVFSSSPTTTKARPATSNPAIRLPPR